MANGEFVKGWCTVCYAPVYRREIQVGVTKPTDELTRQDFMSSDTPTVQQAFYVFSMEPFGPSIEFCPFCGSRYM
jgi:hypothetical protein